jgi:hypothetical protein
MEVIELTTDESAMAGAQLKKIYLASALKTRTN